MHDFDGPTVMLTNPQNRSAPDSFRRGPFLARASRLARGAVFGCERVRRSLKRTARTRRGLRLQRQRSGLSSQTLHAKLIPRYLSEGKDR